MSGTVLTHAHEDEHLDVTAPETAVPASLRRLPQWVVYRVELKDDGKPTKVPYQPHDVWRKASSTNQRTWATYDDACAAVRNWGNRLDGVGFVFTRDDPYCGIDLDHCVQPDGELTPFAESVVAMLDSYAEYSPSGDGIHVLTKAEVPAGHKNERIEIYSSGRYFTVTGRHVPGTPSSINDRQSEVMEIWEREFPQDEAPDPIERAIAPVSLDDARILDRARSATNSARFIALFDRGETQASASEADLALCNMLAFWTGRDPVRIDSLFRQSALYRKKWDERHYGDGRTYGQATIEKAISGATETFSGSGVEVAGDSYGMAGYQAPETVTELLGEGEESAPLSLGGRVDLWPWIEGEQPEPEWLIEGVLLPGMVTLLHGEPGCGKTILALHFSQEMARAGRTVLFVDEESGAPMTGSRLRAMGMTAEEASLVHYYPFSGFTLADANALLSEVAECRPTLIIFDSMADVLSASGLDENAANDVTKWMVTVAIAAARSDIAPCVIILDHNTKDSENVKYSRGSGAKKAKADVAFFVNKMAEFDRQTMGRVRLERTKNRPGVVPESKLYVVGGDGNRIIVEPFDPSLHVILAANALDMKALDAIEEMGETGMGSLQLQGVLGRGKSVVATITNRLENSGYIERRGAGSATKYHYLDRPIGRSDRPADDAQSSGESSG